MSISPGEANELITSNEDLVILDIRAVEAYNAEHIKNAACEEELEGIDQYIGKEILVYDDNGTESMEYGEMLAQLSFQGFRFKKIYNLEGGLKAWKEAGFQTVKTGTLTPPLPSFPTSSPTVTPSPASTSVATSTSAVAIPSQTTTTPTLTPTASTTTAEPSSQIPGFEITSEVIGILICVVIMKARKLKGVWKE